MDDGITSAEQIGEAIKPLCSIEMQAMAETSTRGMKRSSRLYEMVLQELQHDRATVTQVVLIARKEAREATERPH